MTADISPPSSREIIARPDRTYRIKRYIMVLVLIGGGFFFIYDGFYKWPANNALPQHVRLERHITVHGPVDILLQRVIGLTLPPLGVLLLIWTLYSVHGVYRLKEGTLYVPGHPPVALDQIRKIDKTRWDRKGIAWLEYEPPTPGRAGRIKLDDFAYQRIPTDEILQEIEARILGDDAPGPPVSSEGNAIN